MNFQPQHPSNQCVDPSDMENWVDFASLTSPTLGSSSKGKMPVTSAHSTMTSPTSTAVPLDAEDQTPVAPSHDYGRFKQQTGLPTGSIASLRALNEDQHVFSNFNSGIDDFGFGNFDGMGSQNGFGSMTGDMGMDSSLPAFFYPNDSQNDDFVDPTAIQKQEEVQNIRYYPGMHQQAALRAQQAATQRQHMVAAQQKHREAEQQRRKASPVDAHAEETIARVVNQIRQNSMMHASMSPEQTMIPQTIKKHKDEEDMDEDERLLNSEEGKKLSSKERRQLRNKVSARAFRSRRKGKLLHHHIPPLMIANHPNRIHHPTRRRSRPQSQRSQRTQDAEPRSNGRKCTLPLSRRKAPRPRRLPPLPRGTEPRPRDRILVRCCGQQLYFLCLCDPTATAADQEGC
jgi:hypothetical protein